MRLDSAKAQPPRTPVDNVTVVPSIDPKRRDRVINALQRILDNRQDPEVGK